MSFAAPFFAAAALWARGRGDVRPLAKRDVAAVVGLGLLSYYLSSFLDFLGLQYITAGLGRLLQFVYPTLVVLLSAVFLGKRATRRDVFALVLTYLGLLLVFWQALGGDQRDLFLGAALVLASAVSRAGLRSARGGTSGKSASQERSKAADPQDFLLPVRKARSEDDLCDQGRFSTACSPAVRMVCCEGCEGKRRTGSFPKKES